jgi:hypothetical protein
MSIPFLLEMHDISNQADYARHDKFGPLLCLNVLSLNVYCGCRNYRVFWMHFKFIIIIKVYHVHTHKMLS